MVVREAVVAVEGEPGDDGRSVWTAELIRELEARISSETDGIAWTKHDARGRLVLVVRADMPDAPGLVRAGKRSDGRDAERIARADQRRARKGAKLAREVAAGGWSASSVAPAEAPPAEAAGGFRRKAYGGDHG